MPRNTTKGAHTREEILRAAADIASVDGIDGLTIGPLAAEMSMSKSGLFAHFGSKEALQLATIEEARRRYVNAVIAPALAAGSGITRLYALCEAFLSYLEEPVFPGGCFFASAMAEFDAKPPSPARDLITECQQQWMATLERAAQDARDKGELRTDTDPRQLAFEIEGALLTANWYFHLFGDVSNLDRARLAVCSQLEHAATDGGVQLLRRAPRASSPRPVAKSVASPVR